MDHTILIMKICPKCNIKKSLDDFYKKEKSKDKHEYICINCKKQKRKIRYINNKNKILIQSSNYYEKNKEKYKIIRKKHYESNYFIYSKSRRKRRALKLLVNEFFSDIDEQFVREKFNNTCYKCGKTQEKGMKKFAIDHHKALSKLNPLTISNAVILCKTCNSKKLKKDPEQFYNDQELFILYILGVM